MQVQSRTLDLPSVIDKYDLIFIFESPTSYYLFPVDFGSSGKEKALGRTD
jgi:hypothetical protein